MKYVLILLACLFLAGCANSVKPVEGGYSPPYAEWGLLIETPEGVKIYRFKDAGIYHYIAVSKTGSFTQLEKGSKSN
jgi:hypothetical protein